MDEREFQRRFHRSVSFWGTKNRMPHYWKLRDDGLMQPYDAYLCLPGGKFCALEYKMNRLVDSLNIPMLFKNRNHQISNLLRIESLGGAGWVVIGHKGNGNYIKCYAMHPAVANGLMANGTSKIEELLYQNMMFECEPCGDGCWDLSKLFS